MLVSSSNGCAIIAYIVSENIRRRRLNAGQRAILIAIAYPEATKYKRGGSQLLEISTMTRATFLAPAPSASGRRNGSRKFWTAAGLPHGANISPPGTASPQYHQPRRSNGGRANISIRMSVGS
jgi:hypothetical protein